MFPHSTAASATQHQSFWAHQSKGTTTIARGIMSSCDMVSRPRAHSHILALALLGACALAWTAVVVEARRRQEITWTTIPETSVREGNPTIAMYLKNLLKGDLGAQVKENYPCSALDGELISYRAAETPQWIRVMMRIIIYGYKDLEDVVFIHVLIEGNNKPTLVALANGRGLIEPLPEFVQTEIRDCPEL